MSAFDPKRTLAVLTPDPFQSARLTRYDAPIQSFGGSNAAAQVHHAARWCGSCTAARGACAARRPDAAPRHLDGGSGERPAISSRRGGIPRGASKARMGVVGKWLGMLKEIAPQMKRVAFIASPQVTVYYYFLTTAQQV